MKVGAVLKQYQNLTTFTITPGLFAGQYVHTIINEIKNDTSFRQPFFETRDFLIGKIGYSIRAQFSESEVSSWFTNLGDKYVYDFFNHSYRPDLESDEIAKLCQELSIISAKQKTRKKIGTLSPFD